MWKEQTRLKNVDEYVRNLRKGQMKADGGSTHEKSVYWQAEIIREINGLKTYIVSGI